MAKMSSFGEMRKMFRVSASEYILLMDIANFDEYYKSRDKIAESMGLASATVSKILTKLKKKGLIEQIDNYYSRRIFKLSKVGKEALFDGKSAKSPKNAQNKASKTKNDSETKSDSRSPETTELCVSGDIAEPVDEVDTLLNDIHEQLGGVRPILHTKTRRSKVKQRLKSFNKAEILDAAYHLSQSKFHMGENDSHTRYATVDFLIRNDETVEKWLYNSPQEAELEDLASRIIY